jgi:hypothetical protein
MANLLAIYLNDHLAASVAGMELAKRCRSNNRTGRLGDYLGTFIAELEEDHRLLREVIDRVGGRKDAVKLAAAWVAERLFRLKLNGHLLSYSPLSRLEELEGLVAGVEARGALWRALQAATAADGALAARLEGFDLERLALRAGGQQDRLEGFRLEAARAAFA